MDQPRREFLRKIGIGTVGASWLASQAARVHASETNTIQIALVGCGGRGGGAVQNAMATAGPTKLVATADAFEDRAVNMTKALNEQLGDRAGVPPERTFVGFDAYKKAIDCLNPGDVVLLATPPVFRPLHVEYAVQKGVNVFMEKPFATDSPGTRRLLDAVKQADAKNVKIACGLMWRHCKARQEVIKRIHDGEIGDLVQLRGFRMHGPYNPRKRLPNETEVSYQTRFFHAFDWSGGNMFIDYCIHNFDVACWAKNAWPVKAIGFGGRSVPTLNGQIFDTWYTEFEFADGSHLASHGRYRNNCFNIYSDFVHGTKGSAVIMDNLSKARTRLYKNQSMTDPNLAWRFEGDEPNPYQVEHDRFFEAIRADKPYNEGHRACEANFASLLSRAAINSGQVVTWDEIVKSELRLCKDVDNLAFDSEPPVKPNDDGSYPYAIPGETVAF